jgi:hypothetical protein
MDVDKVFDVESTTSYMDMLNDSSVDLAVGIDAFDGEDNVEGIDDEEEEGEGDEGVDDEEVVEVDPAAAGSSAPLLQNSLPVTGPKGPLVTGKVPVTGNSSLVRGYQ